MALFVSVSDNVEETGSNIWHFVETLLFAKNRVDVNGLGTFEAVYEHARIDSVSGTIYPPAKTFFFRPSYSKDNTLTAYIAEKAQIPEHAAEQEIATAVAAALSQLETQGVCQLGRICTLQKGRDGLAFVTSTVNFFMPAFGLAPVKAEVNTSVRRQKRPLIVAPPVVPPAPAPAVKEKVAEPPRTETVAGTDPAPRTVKRLIVNKKLYQDDEALLMQQESLAELRRLLAEVKRDEAMHQHRNTSKLFPVLATVLTLVLLVNVVIYFWNNSLPGFEKVNQMNMGSKLGVIADEARTLIREVNAPRTTPPATTGDHQGTETNVVKPEPTATVPSAAASPVPSPVKREPANEPVPAPETAVPVPVKKETPKPAAITITEKNSIKNPLEQAAQEEAKGNKKSLHKKQREETVADASGETSYYIVAGAFRIEKNAEKCLGELRAKGFKNAEIISPARYKFRIVSYKRFTRPEEADEILANIRHSENADAWIYAE